MPRLTSSMFALLLMAIAACAPGPTRTPTAPKGDHITVATFNVNYGLASDPVTLEAVLNTGADIVALQETTPDWEHVIESSDVSTYPYRAYRHSRGAGGLALLSNVPFQDAGQVDGIEGWFPSWRVIAASPIGEVQLILVHLRPPVSNSGSFVSGYFSSPGVHREEIAQVTDAMDSALPTLILGDFNEEPGGAALAELEVEGLHSVLPEFAPDAVTWHWDYYGIDLEGTLDHIVYDDRLTPLSAEVLEIGRSDHQPVIATFERANSIAGR